MNDKTPPNQPDTPRRLTAEQWVLLAGGGGFALFLSLIFCAFLPLIAAGPISGNLPPAMVEMAATRGFSLPPTWTPAPPTPMQTTPTPTAVWDGVQPTRMYTPVATSMPGIPMPEWALRPNGQPMQISVLDLARIMQGESPGDKQAAYMVGWVAKNRLLHAGYGDTYAIVSHGFFGYRAEMNPSQEFLDLARRVIRDGNDPTDGCLYALSRTDITNLGVPPERADVAFGEWFFFRTWPAPGR